MRIFLRSLTACAASLSIALLAGASDQSLSQPSQRYRALGGSAVKLQVTDGATAAALSAGGARLIADYGSYQLFEASAAALQDLAGRGLQDRSQENSILLHAGLVDTTAAATRSARPSAGQRGSFTGRRMHLVQFAGPIKPEWYEALLKTGVQVIDFIPHNAYLVYGDAAALQAVHKLALDQPTVQFDGAFLDSDRINPGVTARLGKRATAATLAGDLYQIQLVKDAAANQDTLALLDSLKVAPIVRQNEVQQFLNIVAKLPASAVTLLSGQPDVVAVYPYTAPRKFDERQDQIVAGNLSGNFPSGPGYLNWLATKGFTQSQFDSAGFVVDVTDSGIDNGTTNANHFGLFRLGTTANVSRVAYNRLEGTANSGSTIQGCDGHGNLNAHIIGGYVTLTNFPHTDSSGYRYGLGVCPFVKVGSSVIFDPANFTNPDYENLISKAYNDGARISSDSWGADTAGAYDADAQAYDLLVRDAQPAGATFSVAGNQGMVICFAAGNAGSGAQTVGSPGTAKNVITVGAAENVHSHSSTNGGNDASGNDGCSTPDSEANSANDMATFSSRGPCSDSRVKPEIVAPGTHITGGVGQNTRTMAGNGTALTCFEGSGVCALPGGGTVGSTNNFFPLGQKWYSTSSGTSHSTPALAGGAALTYQWHINQYAVAPSPAMVKALLMNSARYMNGTGAGDSLPSNNQGMGMMNLGTLFDGTQRFLRDQATNDFFTASGQTRSYTVQVASNSKPVRVTLTWTDAAGSTSGNAYKNNLDLSVAAGGQTYKGNVFSGSNSVTGGSADLRNNSESVFLPAGTTGTVVVTVTAYNINSDGIPNYGTSVDQDFALVVYNGIEVQAPALVTAGSQITSESCGIGNGSLDPDEIVTVKFAIQNVGSADTTNVVATLLSTGNVGSPSGAQSYGALLAGGAAATNAFTFTVTGACGGVVSATLALQDGATSLGSLVYDFTIGGTSASGSTNSNPSSITIVDNASASPYPSSINVAGLVGNITKVRATLTGFTHTYPEDVDVLLVSPGGQSVALMGAVGGGTDVSGASLTFDDAAASQIGATVTSGTYKPTGSIASMPSPAPASPYGSEMAAFNGASPNGTWSLYVVDAAATDSGSISGGWRLEITVGVPLCCASNQPPILSAIGNKAGVQSNLMTFVISAVDPADGDAITLSASNLPSGAVFNTVTNAGGVTNTFTWTEPFPPGIYTSQFYAVDKDGADSEAILITIGDGSCVGSNIVSEGFDASTSVPAGWTDGGTANDTSATHYQSAANCRALGAADTLVTPAVDYPTQIVFYVDASSGGNGQTATIEYSVGGGSYVSLGSFVVGTAGSNVTYVMNAAPNLSASAAVKFRFGSSFNTWYLDDVRISGGCAGGGGGSETPPVLAAIGAKSVLVSNLLQFAVSATPTDGDTVTLTASNLPAGASFSSTNENGTFVWTNASPVGVYTTGIYAADNDGVDSEAVVITVSEQVEVSSNAVVGYIFEDNGLVFTRAADSVLAGVTPSLFDSGNGGTTNATGNPNQAIVDTGFTSTTDNWYEFTLTIGGGSTISVSRLKFDDRRSNTGPSSWAVRYSVDSYASDLASGGTHTSFATNEATLAASSLSGAVTFRIYGMNGTAGGTWRMDNVFLYGGGTPVETNGLPSLAITTATQSVSNPTTSIPVGGTADTNVVGEISWTNSLTGGSGTIAASTSWLIGSVALDVGANVITVRGTNGSSQSASANVTITRQSGGGGGGALTNILFQGFEPGDGWSISAGGANVSTNPGAADFPPGQRIRNGTNSWQVVNASATLDLASSSIAGFTGRQVRVYLSSTAGTSGNGAEGSDSVRIFASLDGASVSATPDVVVAGYATSPNNARWGFWATNSILTTAGTIASNQAPQANLSSNNYANLFINLPDGATSVALRVTALNNSADERWNVDDIAVVGYATGGAPDTTPILVITTANQTVSFSVTNATVGGTSSNLAGEIRWTNTLSGGAGAISAAANWAIGDVALAVGTNAISVSGSNALGVVTSATVSIARESSDTDSDGIADAWEQAFFGNLTTVNGSSDYDGDGFLDLHEYLAGSVPTNDVSLLKATATSNAPADGVVVQWQSESNKAYTVSRAIDPLSTYEGVASNIAATYPLNSYTDAVPTTTAVYRIELELP